MVKHNKLEYVQKLRNITDSPVLKLPLPNINPDFVSFSSVIMSIISIFILRHSKILFLISLIFVLLLDWLDGLIAKKYNKESEKGYVIDIIADRISEGIIFVFFFTPWFYLFILNCILSIFSYLKRIHIILPLRAIFIIYFLLVYILKIF